MLNAYDVLATLAKESGDRDGAALRAFLWRELPRLDDAIQSTLARLARLGDSVALESATIYVADPRYQQGATAVLLDYRAITSHAQPPFRHCRWSTYPAPLAS